MYEQMLSTYPDVLVERDIQDILRVSRSKAYDILRNPSLQTINVGRTVRVLKSEFVRFLQNSESKK